MQEVQGRVIGAPLPDAYMWKKRSSLLPRTVSGREIDALSLARHYSNASILKFVLPLVSKPEAAVITGIVNKEAVPLRFTVDVKATLIADPRSGMITDIENMEQTIYAAPAVSGYQKMDEILSRPLYRSSNVAHVAGE
jgi:hypothetical protein